MWAGVQSAAKRDRRWKRRLSAKLTATVWAELHQKEVSRLPQSIPDTSADSEKRAVVRSGFIWHAADAYLFDIDGTLLNSRDAVHYFSFRNAVHKVLAMDVSIDGVPVHGNTDMGIMRAVLSRAGLDKTTIERHTPEIFQQMIAEVNLNQDALRPEPCPSITELIERLHQSGKLLGIVSGNLEPIGWLKLEKAGLRSRFQFGAFSYPLELRADIFRFGLEQATSRLGTKATACVVGDTPADVAAARAVGLQVIAMATGIYSFAELLSCRPDACLACGTDLLALPLSDHPSLNKKQ
jgi:phosphoglycolate phosphatase